MSLSMLTRTLAVASKRSARSTVLASFSSKKTGFALNSCNSRVNYARLFSSHAPVKKDDKAHDASHGHGHGHAKEPVVIPESYKKEPQEHLFSFEEGDYIPPTETHAVGNEKLEIDFGPFDTTVCSGGFGTRANPVEVPSRYNQRIVGCTGSAEHEHEVLWHEVKLGKDLICMECGQVFKLTKVPGFEDFNGAHHGHDDHHEEQPFSGHVDGDGYRFMMPPKTKAERAAEKAERDEELRKDPKSQPKKTKSHGVDYHQFGEHNDEEQGKLASSSPVFQDRRPQPLKDRK